MADTVDARGLSCPQPVLLTNRKMKDLGKGIFQVLVDTETSKENISRLAQQLGWAVEVKQEKEEYRIILKKD